MTERTRNLWKKYKGMLDGAKAVNDVSSTAVNIDSGIKLAFVFEVVLTCARLYYKSMFLKGLAYV